jgi:iron-sulfur cluster assembly protein
MVQRRGKGLGIRVGVKTTGCSGLAYVLEFVDQPTTVDLIHQFDGFIIAIDPKHIAYLNEMTIDYARNGLNEGFEFKNPIEKDRCGCGESFRV